MFPSPQVGSGRQQRWEPYRNVIGFHPLKSGRDTATIATSANSPRSFHPLKSGRDCRKPATKPTAIVVSIPSSRVGTTTSSSHRVDRFCFHPLKSGRDLTPLRRGRRQWKVSIPSSRVGTPVGSVAGMAAGVFPSPQVGSGLLRRRRCSQISCTFPSPQVGSGHAELVRARRAWLDVSIPSSRVGTKPRVPSCGGYGGFHPLKSGRDCPLPA